MKSLIALLLVLFSVLGVAAEKPENDAPPPASVVILNREVVTFRTALFGYSPQERATAAETRIRRLLDKGNPKWLETRHDPKAVSVVYHGELLFALMPGDVNELAGETLTSSAVHAREQIAAAMSDVQAMSTPKAIAWAIVRAVLATATAVIMFIALMRFWRWWQGKATRLMLGVTQKFHVGPLHISGGVVRQMMRWLAIVLLWPVGLLVTYFWLSFVLGQFPPTRAWAEELDQHVFDFLSEVGAAMLGALPGLAIAVFIVLLTRWITRSIHYMFDRIESGRAEYEMFDRDTASTTRRLLIALCWLIAAAMIYPYLPGADTDAFKGLSVMVGLMFSLGGASVVGQFASGLILIYSRAVKLGEYVKVGEHEGTVSEIGIFATKIQTNLREEISIPNAVMAGQNVINYSRLASNGGVVVSIVMTIGYDTPWRQVHAMMKEGADRTEGVRKDPLPVVFQTALSDWYVEYQLRVALDEPRRKLEILNELHGHLQDVFNEYGVQIMSPHYIADTDQAKVVPVDGFWPAPARKP
ncbi:mechanosensitive ion channel family protein [Chitinibacteraceae bacterium HSL-7]